MEKCRQCDEQAEEHPVVAIMKTDAQEDHRAALAVGSNFTGWPMCAKCHQSPRLKAHYHYRAQWKKGLDGAERQILRSKDKKKKK